MDQQSEGIGTEEHERAILDRQLNGLEEEKVKRNVFAFATFTDKVIVLISIVCTIVAGALNPLVPFIYGLLVGKFNGFAAGTVTAAELRSKISAFSLYYVYLSVALFVLTYISTVGFYYSGERIARALRAAYLSAILRQNMAFFDLLRPGEITNRIMSDMATVQEAVTSKLPVMLNAIAQFCAAFVIAFIMYWKLALVTSPFFLAMIATGGLGGAYAIKHHKIALAIYSQASGVAEEAISAAKYVISFGIQPMLSKRYVSLLNQAENANTKAETSVSAIIAWSNAMPCLLYALSFWAGSKFLVKGELSVSELTTITLTVVIGSFAITRIAPSAQAFTSGIAITGSVLKVIARQSPQDPFDPRGETPESVVGDVHLESVGLVYPSRENVKILKNTTFSCPAMKKTAIVGASGCGKSSILGLLERFYEPTSGKVLLDGRDIQLLNLRWLRRQISLVDQNTILFNASVFDNIQYGDSELSNRLSKTQVYEEVIEAAKKANVHDFIITLPDGYNTQVGEKGLQLSGGQRQRIAIARALIKRPKVLLLDEATSALDSKSEAIVQRALDSAAENCTTIIIAHRLSTICNADNIIVLAEGNVSEQGTHQELLAKNGVYAALVDKQRIEDTKGKDIEIRTSTEPENGLRSGSFNHTDEKNVEAEEPDGFHDSKVTGEREMRNTSQPLSAKQTLAFIGHMSKGYWKALVLGLLCAIFAGLGIPAQSIIFAELLTALGLPLSQYNHLKERMDFWSGLYVAVAGATFIFWMGVGTTLSYATRRLSLRVREACFNSIMVQDIAFFDAKGNEPSALSSILTKSTNDLAGMGGPVLGGILTFLSTIIGGIILSISIGWKLALVCTATIPVVGACGWLRLQILSVFDGKIRQSGRDSATYSGELIRAIRTVTSLGLEEHALARYEGFSGRQAKKSLYSILSASSLYAASQSLVYFCAALAFWYGGNLIADNEYTTFQFYVCFVSLISGSQIAGSIFTYAPDASKAMHASAELQRILEAKPHINNIPRSITSSKRTQENEQRCLDDSKAYQIHFENVDFTYPSRPKRRAIGNLSFSINTGQTLALVGQSGSGKSTCISLLERFYDPDNGRILVDGQDIRTLDIDDYRRSVSLVSQETIVFSGTVRENIAIGLAGDPVSDDVILEACKQANILEFIESLPEGLSTIVGTGGSMLSGGQKQRIAIARALLRKPKLLLLDEATSALDTESEAIVQKAMDAARKGRTTVMVAHRLRTVVDADIICVLENGTLQEMGNHKQLMGMKGKYWEMVELQALH